MGTKTSDIDVLLISDLYPSPEAPVRGIFVRDHARSLLPYANSVTVANITLSGKEPEMVSDEVDPRIRVLRGGIFSRRVPSLLKAPLYGVWAKKGLDLLKANVHPDILHAHGGILSGTLARRFARSHGAPYFITEHFGSLEQWTRDPLKRRILRKNYRGAERVIGVSEHLKERISAHFPKAHSISLPNPVDTELFHTGHQEREKMMLFASRLDPNKGAMRALQAFDAIHREIPNWKLRIHGEGAEASSIKDYLESRSALKEQVEFAPKLSRESLAEAMRKASFTVLPSEYESFGLVIAESLSSGTPVIAPDRTGPRDILFEGCGKSIDPLDQEALERAMLEMTRTHGRSDPYALHEGIEERFGMERTGQRTMELYQKVLEEG